MEGLLSDVVANVAYTLRSKPGKECHSTTTTKKLLSSQRMLWNCFPGFVVSRTFVGLDNNFAITAHCEKESK